MHTHFLTTHFSHRYFIHQIFYFHSHWPLFSHWLWHFLREPLTHIMRYNLYYPFTHSPSLDTEQTGGFIEIPLIVSVYTICSAKKEQWNAVSGAFAPLSLPLDCWCDSWPGGHLPHCVFVPLPIQHLPKAQCSSSTITANSHQWQPSLHFSNATLSATSWSDSKWQLLPQSPRQGHVCVV